MIDGKDKSTVDGLPKKMGRPCLNSEGPMSGAHRQRRRRDELKKAGNIEKPLILSKQAWDKAQSIAERKSLTVSQYIEELLQSQKMPRKTKP